MKTGGNWFSVVLKMSQNKGNFSPYLHRIFSTWPKYAAAEWGIMVCAVSLWHLRLPPTRSRQDWGTIGRDINRSKGPINTVVIFISMKHECKSQSLRSRTNTKNPLSTIIIVWMYVKRLIIDHYNESIYEVQNLVRRDSKCGKTLLSRINSTELVVAGIRDLTNEVHHG